MRAEKMTILGQITTNWQKLNYIIQQNSTFPFSWFKNTYFLSRNRDYIIAQKDEWAPPTLAEVNCGRRNMRSGKIQRNSGITLDLLK